MGCTHLQGTSQSASALELATSVLYLIVALRIASYARGSFHESDMP